MIRIGFCTIRKNWLSRAIRWFTGERFTHTYIVYPHELYDSWIAVEADLKGIIERRWEDVIDRSDIVSELVPPEGSGIDLADGMPAIAGMLGSRYDYESLFGRAIVIVLKWIGIKIRNPLGDSKEDTCIENVLRLLEASGVDIGVDRELSTPGTVYEILCSSGWKPKYEKGM